MRLGAQRARLRNTFASVVPQCSGISGVRRRAAGRRMTHHGWPVAGLFLLLKAGRPGLLVADE